MVSTEHPVVPAMERRDFLRPEQKPCPKCGVLKDLWHKDSSRGGGGKWDCRPCAKTRWNSYYAIHRVERAEKTKLRRNLLVAAGLCTSCAKRPLATEKSVYCNPCLDKLCSPERLIKARRSMALKRREERHRTLQT